AAALAAGLDPEFRAQNARLRQGLRPPGPDRGQRGTLAVSRHEPLPLPPRRELSANAAAPGVPAAVQHAAGRLAVLKARAHRLSPPGRDKVLSGKECMDRALGTARLTILLGSVELDLVGGTVPFWLKVAHTLFVCILVPVYWRSYGPANFLWFSDIALLVTLPALWLEDCFLASTQAVSVG